MLTHLPSPTRPAAPVPAPAPAPTYHDKPHTFPSTFLRFRDPALSLLELSASLSELRQLHARLVVSGTAHHPLPLSRLLSAASHIHLPYALLLFHHSPLPSRNLFIWTSLLRFLSSSPSPHLSLHLYILMLRTSPFPPDHFSLPSALRACSALSAAFVGRALHAHAVKHRLLSNPFVRNALLKLYLSCGHHGLALQVFDEIADPSDVAWNILIDWHGKAGKPELAHQLFIKMPSKGIVTWNSLVAAYARAGAMAIARSLFDKMPRRNVTSWNTLIGGYIDHGESKKAILAFHEMQKADANPDKITLALVLSACGELGAIEQGRWLHRYVKERGIGINVFVETSLIHMYAKSGFIGCARKVFEEMPARDVQAWNAMIGSLAIHGLGREALSLFAEMNSAGIMPDEVTFLVVLSACGHAGLVQEGLELFRSMTMDYKIEAMNKHYTCMVDLLGRAGMFREAQELINSMPKKPGETLWGALLGASKIHGNANVGEEAGKHVIEMDPHNDGRYAVLSNVYAACGDWAKATSTRRLMKDKGVKKRPGCSLIEIDGIIHEFLVHDRVHPQREEIYFMLSDLMQGIRSLETT